MKDRELICITNTVYSQTNQTGLLLQGQITWGGGGAHDITMNIVFSYLFEVGPFLWPRLDIITCIHGHADHVTPHGNMHKHSTKVIREVCAGLWTTQEKRACIMGVETNALNETNNHFWIEEKGCVKQILLLVTLLLDCACVPMHVDNPCYCRLVDNVLCTLT